MRPRRSQFASLSFPTIAEPSFQFPEPVPARHANSHCASDGRSNFSPVFVLSRPRNDSGFGSFGHSQDASPDFAYSLVPLRIP